MSLSAETNNARRVPGHVVILDGAVLGDPVGRTVGQK